jgi:hypothetical protein
MFKTRRTNAWLPTWYDTDLPIDAALSLVILGITLLALHALKFF